MNQNLKILLVLLMCGSSIAFGQDGGAKGQKPPHPIRKAIAQKKGNGATHSGTIKQQTKPVRKEAVL
jgi:hypothetical protein